MSHIKVIQPFIVLLLLIGFLSCEEKSNNKNSANALEEIIDVHHRYRNFSALTQEEAREYIEKEFPYN